MNQFNWKENGAISFVLINGLIKYQTKAWPLFFILFLITENSLIKYFQ